MSVLCVDFACAQGITRAGVHELAIRLQTLGYVVGDDDSQRVAASPAEDRALRSPPGNAESRCIPVTAVSESPS
jgi:hypothetical protein